MSETDYVPTQKLYELRYEPCASMKNKPGNLSMKCGRVFMRTSIPKDAIRYDCPSCGRKPIITVKKEE